MMTDEQLCTHITALTELKKAEAYECAECKKTGSRWVHLRTCQTCGTTLCCDDSPNKHMTQHYQQSQHPVISSSEPGERWLWCYPDEQVASY